MIHFRKRSGRAHSIRIVQPNGAFNESRTFAVIVYTMCTPHVFESSDSYLAWTKGKALSGSLLCRENTVSCFIFGFYSINLQWMSFSASSDTHCVQTKSSLIIMIDTKTPSSHSCVGLVSRRRSWSPKLYKSSHRTNAFIYECSAKTGGNPLIKRLSTEFHCEFH